MCASSCEAQNTAVHSACATGRDDNVVGGSCALTLLVKKRRGNLEAIYRDAPRSLALLVRLLDLDLCGDEEGERQSHRKTLTKPQSALS